MTPENWIHSSKIGGTEKKFASQQISQIQSYLQQPVDTKGDTRLLEHLETKIALPGDQFQSLIGTLPGHPQ